jgi:hypothetical protein
MPQIVTANNRRFKCLPFGDAGSGKTFWSCGAQDHPDMRPVLVLDSDDGLLSVAARGDIAAEECKSLKDYERVLGRIAADDPVFREFKTIITDSGSDLLDKGLREEAGFNFERSKEAEEQPNRKGKRPAKRHSADELHQKDYGVVTSRMKRLFDLARGLPKHVIITSLAATHFPVIGQDEYGNDKLGPDPDSIHPAFTAKLGLSVRGLMDFVWYFGRTTKEENGKAVSTFKFLTQEVGAYKCKTRGVAFPAALGVVSSLSLPEVYDLLLKTEGGAR